MRNESRDDVVMQLRKLDDSVACPALYHGIRRKRSKGSSPNRSACVWEWRNDSETIKRWENDVITTVAKLKGLWIDVRNEWIKMSHRSKIKMIHLKIFHSTNKSPRWGLPILQDPDEIPRATSGQIGPNFIPHVGFG